MEFLVENEDSVDILIQLQPKATRAAVRGLHGERLKIAVNAPPVDDKANNALIKYLAEILSIPASGLVLIRGQKSREKTVRITGAVLDDIKQNLEKYL